MFVSFLSFPLFFLILKQRTPILLTSHAHVYSTYGWRISHSTYGLRIPILLTVYEYLSGGRRIQETDKHELSFQRRAAPPSIFIIVRAKDRKLRDQGSNTRREKRACLARPRGLTGNEQRLVSKQYTGEEKLATRSKLRSNEK